MIHQQIAEIKKRYADPQVWAGDPKDVIFLLEIITQQQKEIDRLNAAHEGFLSDWTSAEIEHGERQATLKAEIEKLREGIDKIKWLHGSHVNYREVEKIISEIQGGTPC